MVSMSRVMGTVLALLVFDMPDASLWRALSLGTMRSPAGELLVVCLCKHPTHIRLWPCSTADKPTRLL